MGIVDTVINDIVRQTDDILESAIITTCLANNIRAKDCDLLEHEEHTNGGYFRDYYLMPKKYSQKLGGKVNFSKGYFVTRIQIAKSCK